MKMQAKLLAVCGVITITGVCFGQNYLAESEAAINMQGTINNQLQPPPVPGQVPGIGNPGAGFAPGALGGNTIPGTGSDIGVIGDPTLAGQGGIAGQPTAVAAPAPIETAEVLVGRRVFDAVSGALLEDAVKISVRASDLEAFADDGISDNGIAGDGIRGNVNTSRNEFIGQFSNTMKNILINAVSNAEQIDPMVYYGYHIAKVDPTPVEGMKRYGLALPGEQDALDVLAVEPDFASIIDLEQARDELVRQWKYEFLANYRVVASDPQSEYFPVFIPSPPLTPANYPVPIGYVAPQAVAKANEAVIGTQVAASIALQQPGALGGDGLGGGIDGVGGVGDFGNGGGQF